MCCWVISAKEKAFWFSKIKFNKQTLTSHGILCFVESLLGISSMKKIMMPPLLRFLSSLYGKEKPAIWSWEFGNDSSSLVSRTTKISTCFKCNSFSWSNLDEIEFLFIYPIIVLLSYWCFSILDFLLLTEDLNLAYFLDWGPYSQSCCQDYLDLYSGLQNGCDSKLPHFIFLHKMTDIMCISC